MTTFHDLNLPKPILDTLTKKKFTEPTPIQEQAIPVAIAGHDVTGIAQTGTGKTLAFALPMLVRILENPKQTGLILVPTRELAMQVTGVIQDIARHLKVDRVVNLIGGMAMHPQRKAVDGRFSIIVATPGRLVDHLERKPALLSKLSMLVLDEADRMLDMGFAPQLRQVFSYLPKQRQTMVFSATLPPEILKITKKLQNDPVRVQVGEISQPAEKVQQEIRRLKRDDKEDALLDELNERKGSVLVFVRTQRRADKVEKYLKGYGIGVTKIHGRCTQGQRNRAMAGFRDGSFRVLVATDIAARGIDVDHVAHVINYDLPQVPEDYIHRIGRTARAGKEGRAMAFISSDENGLWRAIELLLKKKGAKPVEVSGKAPTARAPQAKFDQTESETSAPGFSKGFSKKSGAKPSSKKQSHRKGNAPSTRAQSNTESQPNFRPHTRANESRPKGFGSRGAAPKPIMAQAEKAQMNEQPKRERSEAPRQPSANPTSQNPTGKKSFNGKIRFKEDERKGGRGKRWSNERSDERPAGRPSRPGGRPISRDWNKKRKKVPGQVVSAKRGPARPARTRSA